MTNFRRIAVALLAFVALAGAEAGAYRCVDANGKVSYSDRRCEPGNSTAAVIDRSGTRLPAPAEAASASAPGSAPASVQGSPQGSAQASAQAAAKASASGRPGGVSPVVQGGVSVPDAGKLGPAHVLAACGTLVTHCVNPPGKSLDTCFASAPRCTSAQPWLDGSSMACCPQACRERYESLRKAGQPAVQAFEQTLNGTGCLASR